MEEDDFGSAFQSAAPALVSLVPFSPSVSPSPRRLSSNFIQPSRPVRAARQLSWVSLQGRLVGAEECSSARVIGGGLSREEVVAWELFSPIHRILIVAVIAVAAAESKKNRRIRELNKSVQLRDQVLLSMQQKLDSLCEQVNSIKEQPDMSFIKNVELPSRKIFTSNKPKLGECGCQLCDQHLDLSNDLKDNLDGKTSREDEIFNYKMEAEPVERRMSDLSWISSVTSSVEIQMSTSEQDVCSLKRECEEKDATIKELSALVHSSNIAGSKRIAELEDIIRRKNSMIIRLKKDLVVLEQKVVQLSRLRRPSFSATKPNNQQIPLMAENLLYDLDSTTSPSSSDSDCSHEKSRQPPVGKIQDIPAQNNDLSSRRIQKLAPERAPRSSVMPNDWHAKSRPASPLQERSMNQKSDVVAVSSFKPKQLLPPSGDVKRSRRRAQIRSNDAVLQKRWI